MKVKAGLQERITNAKWLSALNHTLTVVTGKNDCTFFFFPVDQRLRILKRADSLNFAFKTNNELDPGKSESAPFKSQSFSSGLLQSFLFSLGCCTFLCVLDLLIYLVLSNEEKKNPLKSKMYRLE